MSNRQYSISFNIGAKLLGTFGASISQAQARMRSLERTAESAAANIKRIWGTLAISLAGFAIGSLFKKAFEGAFEAAADAQQRALSLTNEFWLHMKKQGYEAAEAQTKWLIDINQKLAQTGVLGRGVFDAMADGLSKIGLAPKEIAAMEPILGGLLVRAKGIRATAADAEELTNNVMRAAKGGRLLGLMTSLKMPVGPSERARLKAYGDDWRGAVQYFMFLASKYGEFNVAMKNTPLGQIQRMRNSFGALARDIGETMLPAQADMAAAWEKALPEIKPAIIGFMSELAEIMGKVALEAGDFADRMAQTDAQDAAKHLKNTFGEIWQLLGFTPTDGSFGQLLAGGFIAETKIFNYLLDEQVRKFKTMKAILDLVGSWMREAFVSPLDAAVHRLQDLISLMTGGFFKASKATRDIMNPPKPTAPAPVGPVMPTAPGVAPPPDWIAKDPRLLKAWIQGARPSTAMTPDVRRNVEAAARAAGQAASVPYPAPPPPPAGRPPPAPTSQFPISPATPSIPIYGQPAGIGGGMPSALPPGATMPYGGGYGGGAVPMPVTGGGAGGGGAGGGGVSSVAPAGMPPSGTTFTAQSVAAIQAERAGFIKELQTPEMVRLIAATLSTEQDTVEGQKDVLEALVNRAAALKLAGKYKGMEAMIKGGFYGPWNRGETSRMMARGISPERMAQAQAIIDSIAAGRNELRGMTDQGGVNEIKGYKEKIRGEYYGFMGGASEHRTAAAQAQAAGVASNAYQMGGIAKTPQLAMLAEKGPEMVLPMPHPTALPSPPGGTGGASMMGRMMAAISPYVQGAMQGRFYAPSWMMGGKGQWMQASMGAHMAGEAGEPSSFGLGEGFRMPGMLGALSGLGKFIGTQAGQEFNMTHAPVIHIHGDADEKAQRDMQIHLEDAHKKFIRDFKDAQRHERRLSYESGYSG